MIDKLVIETTLDYVPRKDLPSEIHRLCALKLELNHRISMNDDHKELLELEFNENLKEINERSNKMKTDINIINKKIKKMLKFENKKLV